VVTIEGRAWRGERFDPALLDAAVARARGPGGALALRLIDRGAEAPAAILAALQIVTRCQRLLPTRNRFSRGAVFDEVLAVHRALHDLRKPLVAADYEHALDTWRWVLRLDPNASRTVQIAALFHDVERLASEADVRVEQHAADYTAFKAAHAAAGARMVMEALAPVLRDGAGVAAVAGLVRDHERGAASGLGELRLLAEADALSFFSLNACGFARYYGPAHTRRKVAYTLARLGAQGRRELGTIRHRADIAAFIAEVDAGAAAAAVAP
jgi:hypothetical protein